MPPRRSRDRFEPFRAIARRIPGGMALARRMRGWLDPELREVAHLRRTEDGRLLQPWAVTWDERYPALFDALAERLAALPAPRILSFGCASGAEVRALRRRMPRAAITGIDLNSRALGQARKADPGHAADYLLGDRPPAGARYDAILALAVFRHGELAAWQPDTARTVLPYARFAETMALLDRALERGGWLALANAQFAFDQLPCAADYAPDAAFRSDSPDVLYGADEMRIDDPPAQPVLRRKRD